MILRGLFLIPLALLIPAGGCDRSETVSRVVLVTFDTTRADHLGCYGAAGDPTPNLDRLAADSVLFEQAVATVPTTLPSHATIFTGLYPQDHGIRYNLFYRLPPEAETLAETLKAGGYSTAGIPGSRIVSASFGLNQGFDTYLDVRETADPDPDQPVRSMSRPAGEVVDLALEWLGTHDREPAFLWVHFYDPHWPYSPPFPHSDRFRDRPYLGEIAYADAQFGRLLDRLLGDPQWERTVLIVAGDHGEGLYDHGERWHTMLLYETTQRVPLIVRAPGARPARVARPVGLADLMPTILDLAGIEGPRGLRGISLRPALEGGDLPDRPIYFESLAGSLVYGWAELRGLRYGPWKLIDSDEPELFDLDADPGEQRNLAATETMRVEDLRSELQAEAEPTSRKSAHGSPPTAGLDPDTRQQLSSLGYVGGDVSDSVPPGAPIPRTLIHLEPELVSAQGAVALGEWSHVDRTCRYVLDRDPTNKWALIHRALALQRLDRTDEALEHALAAVRIYPDHERAHQTLAGIHRERDQVEEALSALREGLKSMPDSEVLLYLALVAAFEANMKEVCDEQVTRAVAEHPDSGRILVLHARCQARDGDTELALATVVSAVDLGFRRLSLLETTEDFSSVIALPGFRALKDEVERDVPGALLVP